jgi:hypothetical protein
LPGFAAFADDFAGLRRLALGLFAFDADLAAGLPVVQGRSDAMG